jgi:thiol-disulfide isomerase/thioredoxin
MKRFLFLCLSFLLSLSAEAVDLSLKNLQGKKERLEDYRGKIVVLNFWATWCVPCRKEMPLFVELQNEYAARGVQWIAVSTDPSESRKEVDGTSDHQSSLKLATGLPATLILDAEGNPRFRIIGESTREVLTERLNYLLLQNKGLAPAELVLPTGLTPEHFHEHESGEEEDHEHEEEVAESGSAVPS